MHQIINESNFTSENISNYFDFGCGLMSIVNFENLNITMIIRGKVSRNILLLAIRLYLMTPQIVRVQAYRAVRRFIYIKYFQIFRETNFIHKEFFQKFLLDTERYAAKNKRVAVDVLLYVFLLDRAESVYKKNKKYYDDISDRYGKYFKEIRSQISKLKNQHIFHGIWANAIAFSSEHRDPVIYCTLHPIASCPIDVDELNARVARDILIMFFSIANFLEKMDGRKIIYLPQYGDGTIFFSDSHPCISFHTISKKKSLAIHIKESPLIGYYNCDQRGYSGWSSFASLTKEVIEKSDRQDVAEKFTEVRNWFLRAKDSKYMQSNIELPVERDYIFLALQTETDKVQSLANIRTYDLLLCMKVYSEKYRKRVVVKRHPLCKSTRIKKFLSRNASQNFIVSDSSIHDLIPHCGSVVTTNSGVGFEALFYLKPVITTGISDYMAVTNFCENSLDLYRALEAPWVDRDLIKKFLILYLDELIRVDDLSYLESLILSLEASAADSSLREEGKQWVSLI